MNVPLTNSVLHSMPPERSGIASALLNASRELAGLLGITVIGAVLRSRQGSALHQGATPAQAFLDGYHDGLLVTVALLAIGAVVGYVALRKSGRGPRGARARATCETGAEPSRANWRPRAEADLARR